MENQELAKRITERYSALFTARTSWDSMWREIAAYIMPRRVPGLQGTVETPSVQNEAMLFDTTAVRANMTLANGQLAWMSPLEAPWFAFEPTGEQGDEEKRWLSKATRTARDELAISSFYTAVHEFYLDRGAFGTAAIYIESGSKRTINAQHWPVGTFVIDEDDNGLVDTVIREFKLSPRQAVLRFGEDKVSTKTLEASKDAKRANDKVCYLHAIYPREDAERDQAKLDDVNMPIASVYVEKDSNHVCKISGFEEMPVMVSRYLEWGSGYGGLYGWSPSFAALPEARQLNFLQKMMDALSEKMAFPPVLAPEELEGEIDPNAMGVTYFSKDLAQMQALPKEWQTAGKYDIGLERVQERQKAINDAFHVDLFQMFAQLTKQMTAREVAERSQEKLIQFSPTFSRLTSELFNPLLERVFGILLRAGKFGEVPQSMIRKLTETTGFVPVPQVQYSSRIALALRSLPALGYQRTLERLVGMAQVVPAVLDNFDFDRAERDTSLIDGMPAEFLKSEQDVAKTREARAQRDAEIARQQAMATAADSASKVGGIPSDTPVGKVIESNLGTAA